MIHIPHPARRRFERGQSKWLYACLTILLLAIWGNRSNADQRVRLKNGMAYQGLVAEIPTLNKNPFSAAAAEGGARPIMLIDDGLRRIYVHQRGMVVGPLVDVRGVDALFDFKQLEAADGKSVGAVGLVYGTSPFNEYGRRIITLRGPTGEQWSIIQGITELNARYAILKALKGNPTFSWDMRIATSSLDSNSLRRIFQSRVDQTTLNSRLGIVRFFIECERYGDAHAELKTILDEFPAAKDMRAQLVSITEQQGKQLIEEAKRRAKVGQEQFARDVYKGFPLDAVGRLTRIEIQEEVSKIDEISTTAKQLVAQLKQQIGTLNANQAAPLATIVKEIEAGLNAATLSRLNDYSRLGNDATLPLDSRVALAISGWLLGQNANEQNLKVATGLIKVRELVVEYLGSAGKARRKAILEQLRNIEGAQPDYVARLLPLLTPVKPWPDGSEQGARGLRAIVPPEQIANPLQTFPEYAIQLPPEYDPLRSYPCIVALHPPGGNPMQQIDWWAGPVDPRSGDRAGRAARNGYIVIAPKWTRPTQRVYEYTAKEHQRVLVSLRDAMRRSSIDSDRVFIAGHGEGATAAWDIAVSHPDLWAGLVSFNAEPSKTLAHYASNAEHVPMYFVMGELDGTPMPLFRNGPILDKYMKVRNDATVIMYRGRPREYFPEELPDIFLWLNSASHVRKPIPREINVETMREGDTFFWWMELDNLKPGTAIDPILWDQAERIRGKLVEGSMGADNLITIRQGPTDRFHIWLTPQMGIDLSKTVNIRYRTRRFPFDFKGDLETILEDTRQRADRKRPYWAKVSIP